MSPGPCQQDAAINEYTALVIAYRDHGLVAAVLERLSTQTIPPAEVLIVDNGGTLTNELVSAMPLHDRIRLVERPDNPGYGAAVNEARGSATASLLVLTHDAEFDHRLAERLLAALEQDAARGAAAPVLHFASTPDRIFSAGGSLTRGGRAVHRTTIDRSVQEVDWVDGAIVMYRRAALEAIDWLAEDYFLYFEDVDTAWRMRRAGFVTVISSEAVAYQQPGAHPMYLGIRNMTLFARRAEIPFLPHLAAVLRRVAEEGAVRVLQRRPPELIAAFRGWRDGRHDRHGKPAE